MFEPGYYKTNFRALRLREIIRWYGWYRGFQEWLKTRFMPASSTGSWMPEFWAEKECQPEDLSPDFWQATKPHRADFEKLGFVQCRLARQAKIINPNIRESGSICYLDATRCCLGQLLYLRSYRPSQRREVNQIIIAFTAVLEHGPLACTNKRKLFDSVNDGKVIRLKSYDVPVIYHRFREELQRRPDAPRPFPDLKSLREWFDARQIKNFEDRIRRRLFIPMTESEIATAQAAMQNPLPQPPPLPRRRFRLEFWPIIILCSLILTYQNLHRYLQMHGNSIDDNTIHYQGQKFKTRVPYATYEDYKDDPNNLDTNDLGRIEQTMESVKIPASFKDRKALIDFLVFDFQFPGYGMGGGQSTNTDDGSVLEMNSVEIPQANKDRVLVVQESGGNIRLVDDFIFEDDGTNDVDRVRLERHELQYFDTTGKLFRKKSL